MILLTCTFCHGGPFDNSEVTRVATTKDESILCGSSSCVRNLFNRHDPATLSKTGDSCSACEEGYAVATVAERGRKPFPLCSRCYIALFFNRSAVR